MHNGCWPWDMLSINFLAVTMRFHRAFCGNVHDDNDDLELRCRLDDNYGQLMFWTLLPLMIWTTSLGGEGNEGQVCPCRAPPCPASMGRVVGKFCFILSSFILRWKLHDDSQHEARCFMLVVNMRLVTCGMIVQKEEFSVQTISHCGLACMIWISAGDFSWSGERVVGLERSTTACRVLIVGRCCQ